MAATLGGAASMYPELARKIIREKNHVTAAQASNTAVQKPASTSQK
jgi:hypothetical protein